MPDNEAIKQACDACRRRKIRCNDTRPCNACQSADLVCRTSLKRQKKGRQGKTANILQELKGKERQIEETNANSLQTTSPGLITAPDRPPPPKRTDRCQFSRTPGLVHQKLVQSCSEYFFSRMRGTVPILEPVCLQKQIDRADECLHAYCLVTAFCAFVVTQTGYCVSAAFQNSDNTASQKQIQDALVEEAVDARKHLDPFMEPVRQSIIIAFLLYGCHIGLGNQRHAYYFLREATTLYTASALDNQGSTQPDEDESGAGNLFWLLLVSERAHAIRRHRPITLRITSETPEPDTHPQDTASIGFRCLVNLYRPFNEQFLSQWNGNHTTCSMGSLVELEEQIQNAVPADIELPDVLMADLRVSQQWLRIMIWQLSTSAGFLSTSPTHVCMDFRYPLLIARDLCLATWKLSRQGMQTHGVGLIEKIFEVTCTLIDIMACLSAAGLRSSGFKLGPQDYLKHFFTLIHDLPGGRVRFLPLLLTKIGQSLPMMVEPITMHLNLNPNGHTAGPDDLVLAPAGSPGNELAAGQDSSDMMPESFSDDWSYSNFNYAEMSRIGDKTPEVDEAFLQYSGYFP
ncbi:hypothetical protein N7532_002549 [Penicillium argentinense]|uniref:Zn(2)-C6 fungal-type domain-containing protein n=1 Tax=Penicillium argentinense TaxID=1131581 RepID=A0A9W9KKD1_9EURO|nr:uncharacterized protein N7532_002549 [Penicillium argentinense]KAJ5109904.1 hypothetical protein N7532_002549 [Penicillium argentinense]